MQDLAQWRTGLFEWIFESTATAAILLLKYYYVSKSIDSANFENETAEQIRNVDRRGVGHSWFDWLSLVEAQLLGIPDASKH